MKYSRSARGSGCGSGMEFAATRDYCPYQSECGDHRLLKENPSVIRIPGLTRSVLFYLASGVKFAPKGKSFLGGHKYGQSC
jgi:hypothetical protein